MKKILLSLTLITTMLFGLANSASAQTIQPRSEYDLCYVNTAGGNLNCRESASTSAKIKGQFKNGTQVTFSLFGDYDSSGNLWTEVCGKSTTGTIIDGWVMDKYLLYVSPSRMVVPDFVVNPNMPDVG